ncbi:helix-turn-helix transcriptional regulator [Rummeliibacillus sp. NPDC094406]|uniref:helix-turn-helix transcriptional regulator n=1 Tax=Rummeliibacillus sp. NPDC094406 TaxID=3364511 RepID=UPI0038050C25
MELESRLKKLRELHQYSQEDVARILDISRQSVSKWELGKGYPDLDNLIKLSDLYGVSLDEIIRGEEKYSGKVEDSQQSELSHKTFGDFMYHYWWLIFPILGMLSPIIYRLIW